MTPRNPELNIDRLVLHGVSPHHRRRVVEAMEKELRRLFAGAGGAGWARRGGQVEVGAREFDMAAGLGPEQIGARVARAIWASGRQAAAAVAVPAPAAGGDATGTPAMSTSSNDSSGGESR